MVVVLVRTVSTIGYAFLDDELNVSDFLIRM